MRGVSAILPVLAMLQSAYGAMTFDVKISRAKPIRSRSRGRFHKSHKFGGYEYVSITHPGKATPWKDILKGQTCGERECARRRRQMERMVRNG